jgi:ATP:cob(I)alamin adenosyltransferase
MSPTNVVKPPDRSMTKMPIFSNMQTHNAECFHTFSIVEKMSSLLKPNADQKSVGVVRAKMYTRTGDNGTTGLFNGHRAKKSDDYFEALGDLDELNAAIGLACESFVFQKPQHVDNDSQMQLAVPGRFGAPSFDAQIMLFDLTAEQSRLLDLGAHLATPLSTSKPAQLERTQFHGKSAVDHLESATDHLHGQLPPLTTFILPSGGMFAAHLHLARTICRRAERHVVPLVEREDADPSALIYLNRLSSYLFAAARMAAALQGSPERLWCPSKPKPTAVPPQIK